MSEVSGTRQRIAGLLLRTATVVVVAALVAGMLAGVDVIAGLARPDVPEQAVGLPDRTAVPDRAALPGSPAGAVEPYREGPVCRARLEPVSCVRWLADVGAGERADVALYPAGLVVATVSGTVTLHDRWSDEPRWRADVGPHPRVWPSVAGTIPVTVGESMSSSRSVARNGERVGATAGTPAAAAPTERAASGGPTVFLRGDRGDEVGHFHAPVEAAAAHGPWLLTTGGGVLSAWAVTGARGWTRDVDDEVWLTSGGAFLGGMGPLEFVSSNTGATLWQVELPGPTTEVVRSGEATVVATGGEQPALQVVDRHGDVAAAVDLPGPVRWLAVDGGRVTALVERGPSGTWLVVVDAAVALSRHTAATRSGTGARRGTRPTDRVELARVHLDADVADTLPPVAADGIVAVAHARPTPTLTVVDLDAGQVRFRRGLERPAVSVAVPRPDTVVVTDARGAWSWSAAQGSLRWRVGLGDDPVLVAERPLVVGAAAGVFALDPAPGVTTKP